MLCSPDRIISIAIRPAAVITNNASCHPLCATNTVYHEHRLPRTPSTTNTVYHEHRPPSTSHISFNHLAALHCSTQYHTPTRGNVQHTMAGVKRTADEISKLEADDVGPVPVPTYDVTKETSAKSVVTSDEYNKLKKGIKHIARRITDPLKKCEYRDASSVVKLVELTEQKLTENAPEDITVTVSGNMGSGMSCTRIEEGLILTARRKK
jgi:hypothetical protein